MTDVNLIPADYTRQQMMRRVGRRFLFVFASLLLLLLAARVTLGVVINLERTKVEKLKNGEVLMEEHKKHLEELTAKKIGLQRRLAMLEQLRGGPPAKEMFVSIDKAINDGVWFTRFTFSRTGQDNVTSPAHHGSGYFIVVSPEDQETVPQPKGLDSGQINIKGMALTHTALADFVNLLVAQPQIRTVQVQNTHSRKYVDTSVVEYELNAVTMSDKAKK